MHLVIKMSVTICFPTKKEDHPSTKLNAGESDQSRPISQRERSRSSSVIKLMIFNSNEKVKFHFPYFPYKVFTDLYSSAMQ